MQQTNPDPNRTCALRSSVPVTIGDYEIIGKPIAVGGMSTLYRVRSQSGRTYALKELHMHYRLSKDVVMRFKQEFKLGSETKIPGLVRMHELFEANRTLNILMDYIEGVTLKSLIQKLAPFSREESCLIIGEIMRIVSKMHDAGWIHRDIKPENVIVSKDGMLYLVDYGISKAIEVDLTKTGTMVGTPSYMAPEQVLGSKKKDKEALSDIYSIGVVFHELLTKKLPYPRKMKDKNLMEMMSYRVEKGPRIALPDDDPLAAVLEKSLRGNADERYESVDVFAKSLRVAASASTSWRQFRSVGKRLLDNFHDHSLSSKPKTATIVDLPAEKPIRLTSEVTSVRKERVRKSLYWMVVTIAGALCAVVYYQFSRWS